MNSGEERDVAFLLGALGVMGVSLTSLCIYYRLTDLLRRLYARTT